MAKKEKGELEVKRDERCFPIAKQLWKEFPLGLVEDVEKQKDLQLKALSLMLAADLNIDQEASYVPQLLLGVLAGINRTLQDCGLEIDEPRIDFIASSILSIVLEELGHIRLGDVTPEDTDNDFREVKHKLKEFFKRQKVSKLEAKYAMEKIFTNFTTFNNAVQQSLVNSTKRMECKILGIEEMSDLTLKKLNDVLISE